MTSGHRGLLACLVVLAASGPVRAACDPAGVDATIVAAGRQAIDAGCPCGDFTSRGAYKTCANQLVRAQVAAAQLPSRCRRDVLRHAKLSVCGRPGSAVCCRARADGRTRHRVVRDATECTPTSACTACVSEWQSVPTGCDTTGCIPVPVCGNGIVEPGEECDPSDSVFCDSTCKSRVCDPPPTACGNGTLDAGEACEPPGVGGCADDCQLASCASAAGEIGIACDVSTSRVGAAATSSAYLVTWADAAPQQAIATVVRRYDANGAPLDPGRTVLSASVPCGSFHGGAALASDGTDFYAIWDASGPTEFEGFFYTAMFGRLVGGGSGIGPLNQHGLSTPFGQCGSTISGPTMAVGVSPARFALGYQEVGYCQGQLLYQDPIAFVADFDPVPMPQSFDIGLFPFAPPPGAYSMSASTVGQLGADTLWVWHVLVATGPEPPYEHIVAGVFTDLDGADPRVLLSHRNQLIGGRPSVAGGAASFLVAWSQGSTTPSTGVTEVRAVRATRPDGRLDPDGGLLLATSSTAITGGPVVAFDGARWLVVWAEESGTTNDLRAVAVASDGTVVDASPRLVASDVATGEPAVASAGDGRALVVFARPDGGSHDVLATFVTP